jgi:hypothetical protein
MLAGEITGALIAAGGALVAALINFLASWFRRQIPAEVAAFATQAAGTLDAMRHGLLGLEVGADDIEKRVSDVTVYLSESERLLGGARLHLPTKAEKRASEFIGTVRTAETALQRAAAARGNAELSKAAQIAYETADLEQRAFAKAAKSSRR